MSGRGRRDELIEVLRQMQEGLTTRDKTTFRGNQFEPIIKAFTYAKDNNIRVLIETSELTNPSAVVVDLDFVGPRFCRGTATYTQSDGYEPIRTKVPYTINYADVYQSMGKKQGPTKIVFEGENPFWDDYREESKHG